ncbi:hypothetical protein N431DRAFT_113348 [Stipitochalara longipes BDJ]|nr:hypothetical protein N431DRAFT_113348 [Stipitochalara longipes BDJ]
MSLLSRYLFRDRIHRLNRGWIAVALTPTHLPRLVHPDSSAPQGRPIGRKVCLRTVLCSAHAVMRPSV